MITIRHKILRRQRIIKGLSQTQVAILAGVSNSTVSKVELGLRTGPNVKRIADALGVPMEELIIEEEEVRS